LLRPVFSPFIAFINQFFFSEKNVAKA